MNSNEQLITTIKSNKPLCSHINKLNKKQVMQIVWNPAQIKCQTHKFQVSDTTICLHCNKIFCGFNSRQKCISSHNTLNPEHIFSINCHTQQIYCSQCVDTIDYIIGIHSNSNQSLNQNQELKKLKRFGEFIHQAYRKSKVELQENKRFQQEMKHSYRGLQNLGNTCFLNTVLQVLNYSTPLISTYKEFKFTGTTINKSITTTKKSLPKQIEYFYDDVIQQGQSKVWHVVHNKKNLNNKNQSQYNQKLIKTITNSKFNQLIKTFFQEMNRNSNTNKLQNNSYQPFQPMEVLDFLAHLDKKYSFEQEQDAQEALLFIIDVLVQGELVSMGYDMDRYKHVEKFIGRQKVSPTQRLFGFYLLSQIHCQNCKKINYTLDLTYHLSINIPTTQNKTLRESILKHLSEKIQMKQKLYHQGLKYPSVNAKGKQSQSLQTSTSAVLPQFLCEFFHEERLTQKENYYKCSSCSSLVGLKKFYLVDLPEILIISIKRFNHKMVKNSKHVQFQQTIDLKDVSLIAVDQNGEQKQINTRYRLYGVIVHLGDTIYNGHYVCFVRTATNIWLRCSDHNVKKITWNQVKQQQAYVLLYEQIKHSQNLQLTIKND